MRSTYKIMIRKPEGVRLLRRSRCRWEDNIRMTQGNREGRCGLDASGSG